MKRTNKNNNFFSLIERKTKKRTNKVKSKTKSNKSKASVLDQWYTSMELARNTINNFYSLPQSKKCKYTVEPSAGEGILLDLIRGEKIGFDLDPKRNDIIQHDFLQTTLDSIPKDINTDDLCFLGNPPFSIAEKFFNHAATMDPSIIAMILPRKFKNPKVQNKLDIRYNLIFSEDISCCYVYKGKKVELPTVFQVWELNKLVDRPIWSNQDVKETDFTFVRNKLRKERISQLKNPIGYVFLPSNQFGIPSPLATTNTADLWELYKLRLKNKKRPAADIIKAIVNSYHFLEVKGDTTEEKRRNANMIAELFNSVKPERLAQYETCSKSTRCNLSQENLLELYEYLKGSNVKSIYYTNKISSPRKLSLRSYNNRRLSPKDYRIRLSNRL